MRRKPTQLWRRLALGSALSLGCLPVVAGELAKPAREAHVDVDNSLEFGPQAGAFAGDTAAEDAPLPNTSDEDGTLKTEVITERYPSRTVKIERHVAQDAEGNYFNHGTWSNWDEKGVLRGTGEYRHGKKHGKWVRWFNTGDGKMFTAAPYKHFQAPFVAEVNYIDDKLNGVWTVLDSQGRMASEWNFVEGQMHGLATWYYPNGQKQREANYQHDQIEGYLQEWSLEVPKQVRRGQAAPQPVYKLVTKTLYIGGRREAPHVEHYSPGKKKVEGTYLMAREVVKTEYDFWNGEVRGLVTGKEGENQRRGLWTWYFQDGGKQLEGEFIADEPVGMHTWWYANGQKQCEGQYEAGKEQGKWVWWHQNGQKQLEGYFTGGEQTGHWISWNGDGKVIDVQDHTSGGITRDEFTPPRSAISPLPSTAEPSTSQVPMPLRIEATHRSRPGGVLRR
jgi:antitoxin component YwqK of YwqJK toxin-antitoxin module